MSFTTVANVALSLNREELELTPLEVTQIEGLILRIEGIMSDYCGRNLPATDYTDKRYSGTGTASLDLRQYPVNTITSVRVRATDGTFTDITAQVEALDDGVLVFLPNSTVTTFAAGENNIFVSYNAGYTDLTVPPTLAFIAENTIKAAFNTVIDENETSEEEGFGDVRFKNRILDLTPMDKHSLNNYRNLMIA